MKLARLAKFALVGGFGTLLNSTILFALTRTGLYYLVASAIATESAIISNFIGNYKFTFRSSQGKVLARFGKFQLASSFALTVTISVLWLLTNLFGEKYLLLWNLVAIVAAFIVNYRLNLKWTWSEAKSVR